MYSRDCKCKVTYAAFHRILGTLSTVLKNFSAASSSPWSQWTATILTAVHHLASSSPPLTGAAMLVLVLRVSCGVSVSEADAHSLNWWRWLSASTRLLSLWLVGRTIAESASRSRCLRKAWLTWATGFAMKTKHRESTVRMLCKMQSYPRIIFSKISCPCM